MAIVFGSPEAMKILQEDKWLRRIESDDETSDLTEQLARIEDDIAAAEHELAILEGERDHILGKINAVKLSR